MHDSEFIDRQYATYRAAGLDDTAAYHRARLVEDEEMKRDRERAGEEK